MALVECKECNRKISEKATCCPKCGCSDPFINKQECPECKTNIPNDSKTCPECGFPFPFQSIEKKADNDHYSLHKKFIEEKLLLLNSAEKILVEKISEIYKQNKSDIIHEITPILRNEIEKELLDKYSTLTFEELLIIGESYTKLNKLEIYVYRELLDEILLYMEEKYVLFMDKYMHRKNGTETDISNGDEITDTDIYFSFNKDKIPSNNALFMLFKKSIRKNWKFSFFVGTGWTLGAIVTLLLGGSPADLLLPVLFGCIFLGIALNFLTEKLFIWQSITITICWLLGGLVGIQVGFIVGKKIAWAIVFKTGMYKVGFLYAMPLIKTLTIVFAIFIAKIIGGIIGGFVTGLTLKYTLKELHKLDIIKIIIGWAIVASIIELIFLSIGTFVGINAILLTLWIIGLALGSLTGCFITLHTYVKYMD